jgi:dienelactone hydrolase
MTAWQRIPFVCVSFTLVAFATGARATEKINLERVTPVPETEPIPIQDFFRPLLLQEPKLNPSGTQIAALISGDVDKHRLLTYEIKTQKYDIIEGGGDKDIDDFAWLNDERLIYFLSTNKLFGLGLFAADVGNLRGGYPLLQYYGARLVSIPPASRTQPLVWMHHDSLESSREGGVGVIETAIHTGHLVNLDTASADLSDRQEVTDNNERHIIKRYPVPEGDFGIGYLADKEGNLEFAFTANQGLATMHHLVGDTWAKCPVDLETIDVVGCGNKPGELIVIGPRQDGQPRALQLMEGATGKLGAVIFQDKSYDFEGSLYRDPKSHDVVGIHYSRNGPSTVWFDESYRNLQKVLDGFFPGQVVRILGSDEAHKIFLVAAFSDRQPRTYSWVDLEKRTAGLFKNSAPWIDPKRMQPMNVVKYKTRDGRHLDAYLTLPAGVTKQNPPPLVVLAHDGPWTRENWGFDHEVQFLASRGYAVLQPNYRGSPGYGWMFPKDDEWAFGKMAEDVVDATKGVMASGLVDSSRIAIMGTSFGGYLAVACAANEPMLFRCAVTVSGIFDWAKVMAENKYYKYSNVTYSRMLRKLGDPKKDPQKYDAISPMRHADQIRASLFIAYGEYDAGAQIAQCKLLRSVVEKNNVPCELEWFRDEAETINHLKNRLTLYSQIDAFLAKNLAPAKGTTVAAAEPSKN